MNFIVVFFERIEYNRHCNTISGENFIAKYFFLS